MEINKNKKNLSIKLIDMFQRNQKVLDWSILPKKVHQ